MNKPGYHDRVIQHSLRWVNGDPCHNTVDDEFDADSNDCFDAARALYRAGYRKG